MIFSMIKKLFSSSVYVQLSEERIRVYHLESGASYEQRPFIAMDGSNPKKVVIHAIGDDAYNVRLDKRFDVSNPFSHPRLLVSSFMKAEKVLMHAIREVHKSKYFAPSPVAIIHPMDKLEGGVTDVECRLYRELALGAGAREVHLHVGEALSKTRFEVDKVRAPESS